MMKKKLIIKSCNECIYAGFYWNENISLEYWCENPDLDDCRLLIEDKYSSVYHIPDWCPLEDEKQDGSE